MNATSTLAAFRKGTASNFDKLNEKITAMSNPSQNDDNRFWQPTVDKSGTGSAIIRFLPTTDPDEVPFVRYWDHGFQGPGGWYINKCLTSLGQDHSDPVVDYNNALMTEAKKVGGTVEQQAKNFISGVDGKNGSKRRLYFNSNILVVDDPGKPENNGKVFLFKYGKKIFEKLQNAMTPKFPNTPKINPFNVDEGANFILNIQKVDGQRNYSESLFAAPGPVADSDEKIEAILNKTHSLKEFIDPKNYPSYDELKAKLNRALGLGANPNRVSTVDDEAEIPALPVRPSTKSSEAAPPWVAEEVGDDGDDELAAFRNMVKA